MAHYSPLLEFDPAHSDRVEDRSNASADQVMPGDHVVEGNSHGPSPAVHPEGSLPAANSPMNHEVERLSTTLPYSDASNSSSAVSHTLPLDFFSYPCDYRIFSSWTRSDLFHTEIVNNPPNADWQCCPTVGSTAALEQTIRMLCHRDRNDSILTEEYTFATALETCAPQGIKVFGAQMDGQGLLPSSIDSILSGWDESIRGARKPHPSAIASWVALKPACFSASSWATPSTPTTRDVAIDNGVLCASGCWFRAELHTTAIELFVRATFASASEETMSTAIQRLNAAIRKYFMCE